MPLDRKKNAGRELATSNSSQGALNKMMAGNCAKDFGTEGNASEQSGTSIFDPVLTELAYRWFFPLNGRILDPFAGGSVRGVVAAILGRSYVGFDLRQEQIEANRIQWKDISENLPSEKGYFAPKWIIDDSRNMPDHSEDIGQCDLIFSCPPYADLEVYSEDPADLSTLPYDEFKKAYFEIIEKACAHLKKDRFACFVVGEVRGKDGNYYNFVGDTVQAFLSAGLAYYNESILVTAIGSLPIRAGKAFASSRKLGKTHQNVLVFVKGSAKKATEAIGEVEFAELPVAEEAV